MKRILAPILVIAGLAAGVSLPALAAPALSQPGQPAQTSTTPSQEPPNQVSDGVHPWLPDMRSAEEYARHRNGVISFAVSTRSRYWGYHDTRIYPSASVLKAMLMVAYLNRSSVRHRDLTSSDRDILWPMITRSDNNAANRCIQSVGSHAIYEVARKAHMHAFRFEYPIWGNSHIDANDQARFLLYIDKYVVSRHRDYALHLLASITPSQRWGIWRVKPDGWRLYSKGGWGSGTGRVDHQVALLRRGHQRVSVAILTYADGSHSYGKETLRGVAKRLLRALADSPSVP
ncbi:MAG: serine hydrolase [Actinobacteria bacterium]|nr:MAG: serine hydrolase [Actinomycetota bacterium]TML78384.1 MAG: serine hydrolase [Actinomycetota bacterium]